MKLLFSTLSLIMAAAFLAVILLLLKEARKCLFEKQCTFFARIGIKDKEVKGKEAIKTGIMYIIITILFGLAIYSMFIKL